MSTEKYTYICTYTDTYSIYNNKQIYIKIMKLSFELNSLFHQILQGFIHMFIFAL